MVAGSGRGNGSWRRNRRRRRSRRGLGGSGHVIRAHRATRKHPSRRAERLPVVDPASREQAKASRILLHAALRGPTTAIAGYLLFPYVHVRRLYEILTPPAARFSLAPATENFFPIAARQRLGCAWLACMRAMRGIDWTPPSRGSRRTAAALVFDIEVPRRAIGAHSLHILRRQFAMRRGKPT